MKEIITAKLLTTITIVIATSGAILLASSIGRINNNDVVSSIKANEVVSLNETAYPYIGYVIDLSKTELMSNEYGNSYRAILETIYPNGYWKEINNSIGNTVDVSAIFTADTSKGLFSINFRFYLPADREYSEEFITPTLNGDETSGTELWNAVIS